MDTLLASRIQFGLSIGFHFIFPPLSIGLAWYLVVLEAMAWRRGNERALQHARYFGRIFAVTFAAGVGTGIVMSFQFGTNWPGFVNAVSDVLGPILVAEVLFAFFIESVFLGIYLFGRGKVAPWLHWASILLVALAATASGFWILAANSWMQTPSGYAVVDGHIRLESFARAVFNASIGPRMLHVMTASLITSSFFVAGGCAVAILRGREVGDATRRPLGGAVIAGLVGSVMSIFPSGHLQAVEVGLEQPPKLATIEGVYETQSHAPLLVFGIPTNKPPYVTARIEVPGMLSFLFDFKGDFVVQGMKDVPSDELPPRILTFVSFHLMVYLAGFFTLVMALAVILLIRRRLHQSRWMLRLLIAVVPLPFLCLQFGWITTEVGRQPWIVYRVLRTADAVSAAVTSGRLVFSLVLFGTIYTALLVTWIVAVVREMQRGPALQEAA